LVTKGGLAEVTEFDGALAAAVHQVVAVLRVEFGSGDDLGQFFHVHRLDVDDVLETC
jgi:hypothetical protein